MQKFLNVALLAYAAFATGVEGADQVLECKKTTCITESNTAQDVELSCGATGEKLKIVFASFGKPIGACPAANVELFNDTSLAFESTDGCNNKASLSKVKELCEGEDKCTIKADSVFTSTEGEEGCIDSSRTLLVHAKCEQTFDIFQIVLALVIGVIGLALGASVDLHHFKIIFREHKRAVIIGFCCQFGIMPALALMFCLIFDFPPNVALGLILVGSAPGGTTSNLVTYWAKGSVALSLTMSAASTLASLGMLPLLVLIYVNGVLDINESVSIPFTDIFTTLFIAVAPAALGVWIRSKNASIAKKVEIFGSILGALFIGAALYIGIKRNPELLEASAYPRTWTSAMLLQPTGAVLGYIIATIAKLPHPERRAVAIETGIQNTTLVIAMVALSFAGCERLEILTFPLLASLTSLINSAWMAPSLRFLARWDSEEEIENLENEKARLAEESSSKVAVADVEP